MMWIPPVKSIRYKIRDLETNYCYKLLYLNNGERCMWPTITQYYEMNRIFVSFLLWISLYRFCIGAHSLLKRDRLLSMDYTRNIPDKTRSFVTAMHHEHLVWPRHYQQISKQADSLLFFDILPTSIDQDWDMSHKREDIFIYIDSSLFLYNKTNTKVIILTFGVLSQIMCAALLPLTWEKRVE